ncbi:hypothetical protein [Rubrimonas cliftonensis]|uniref:Tetratricopeptide repeat-containing protein n=1 Tax=Rubrimonas cliftonensis TaxID=89524 RepID=A0A1H4FA62_9RHOB|nr:hypothetical protein [Rubrimonas cliftonensis]SEA94189.1 Tetratricopeptide repeat-containing protein [Rubrimonas cliftonensis]
MTRSVAIAPVLEAVIRALRLCGVAAALCFSGVAAAQQPEPRPGPEAGEDARAEGAETTQPSGEPGPQTIEERLDALFTQLRDSEGPKAAGAAHGIQNLWSQSGSDSMDFLLGRGREALDAEDYDKAVEHFTALVTLDPDFAEGWNMRATAYFLNDELWLSMADIQRTLALEPRHFGALSGMAAIFSRIGAEDAALAAARAALAVNPHLEQARELEKTLAPKVDGRDI